MRNLLKVLMLVMLCPGILWSADMGPSSLRAAASNGVVYLHWSPPDKATEGCWVYRALPGGDFQRVSTSLIKEPFYKDQDVVNGQYYWYIITAVDKQGNEGAP